MNRFVSCLRQTNLSPFFIQSNEPVEKVPVEYAA
jgi:hypothetical protein